VIKIHTNNFGKGINRLVNWATGRVDWHNSYAEAKDNALKGN